MSAGRADPAAGRAGARLVGRRAPRRPTAASRGDSAGRRGLASRAMTDAARLERHRRLRDADHRHLWHPFTQMQDWLRGGAARRRRGRRVPTSSTRSATATSTASRRSGATSTATACRRSTRRSAPSSGRSPTRPCSGSPRPRRSSAPRSSPRSCRGGSPGSSSPTPARPPSRSPSRSRSSTTSCAATPGRTEFVALRGGLPRRHDRRGLARRHRPLPPASSRRSSSPSTTRRSPTATAARSGRRSPGCEMACADEVERIFEERAREDRGARARAADAGGGRDDRAAAGLRPADARDSATGTARSSSATRWRPASAAPGRSSRSSRRASSPTSSRWRRGSPAATCRSPPRSRPRGLRVLPRPVRVEADLLPRPHLRREPARLRRRDRVDAALRSDRKVIEGLPAQGRRAPARARAGAGRTRTSARCASAGSWSGSSSCATARRRRSTRYGAPRRAPGDPRGAPTRRGDPAAARERGRADAAPLA